MPTITYYRGDDINTLSREQLIYALEDVGRAYANLLRETGITTEYKPSGHPMTFNPDSPEARAIRGSFRDKVKAIGETKITMFTNVEDK
jgi:hypothetical protein